MRKVRQKKVAALLQSAIAAYLEENKDTLNIDGLIMIDDVFLSADLRSASVWVSFHPRDDSEKKFKALMRGLPRLQSHLFKGLKMRWVPKITLNLSDPERQYYLEDIFDTLESHERQGRGDTDDSQSSQ